MSSRRNGKQSSDGSYQSQVREAISRYLPHKGLKTLPGNLAQRWTARLLVIGAIVMAWDRGETLIDRFQSARCFLVEVFRTRRRPGKTYAGFIAALAKMSDALLATVTWHLRQTVEQVAGESWTIAGWLVFGFDGSKINCPMTEANEEGFGLASRQKSWPQMLLTVMFHVGTGLPWSFSRDGAKGSERSHLMNMLCLLPKAAMVVADAGLTGYDVFDAVLESGRSFLIRVGSNVQLLTGLGYAVREFDGLVYLWPIEKQSGKKRGRPLILRLITLTDGRNRRMHLLTNVMDASLLSDQAAMEIYKRRWPVELLYRSLKQTMSRRKMLSDSPRHAEVELDWSVIGLWVLGLASYEAAGPKARPSIAGALRALRSAMAGQGGRLWQALKKAVQDGYKRLGSKKARHWPHKKKEKPPGNPKARKATEAEVLLAQEFLNEKVAA